jgi:hypothetical protein
LKALLFEKDLSIVNSIGHREHWFGWNLKASCLEICVEIAICVVDRELFALHVAYDAIRKQRNELSSQLGFIHLIHSSDLRHSNLPTEAM